MNRGPTERAISEWLADEAPFELDELVLDATFVRTRRTRQSGRAPIRRLFTMNRSIAVAAGAVAIVIAVVGAALLIRPGTSNLAALPSAPPTPLASTATSLAGPSSSATPGVSTSPSSAVPLGVAVVDLDGAIRQSIPLPSGTWAPAVGPGGTSAAYVEAGHLKIATFRDGFNVIDTGVAVTGRVPGFGTFPVDAAPAWSPDGSRIAYVSSGDVYVVTTDAPFVPKRLTTDPRLDEWPAWSPDGRTIYYANEGSTALDDSAVSQTQEIWRVASTGGTPKRVTNDDIADLQPDISRTGELLVSTGDGITALDPSNGRNTNLIGPGRTTPVRMPSGWNPRWSPDSTKVALLVQSAVRSPQFGSLLPIPTGFPLMDVVVVDLATGQSTTVGPRVQAFWNPVSWTPDGQGLLIARFDGGGG